MTLQDDPFCHLSKQRTIHWFELLTRSNWFAQHLIADGHNLIHEQVVKDPISAEDHNVTLVSRHAMYCTAALDDLDHCVLREVGVNRVIHSSELEWALRVAVDTLHLRVENRQETAFLGAAQHENLTITDRADGDHGVQLAVDLRAVVHDGSQNCRGTEAAGALVSLSQQGDGAKILLRLLSREQLLNGKLLHAIEQLVR
mmetsp:Transcript_55686/g.97215  ORF Transcript_55686/g.97215 Transcript_55686/m.97215 type:complete len:200 (-) Transcript_55686:365-964(-)